MIIDNGLLTVTILLVGAGALDGPFPKVPYSPKREEDPVFYRRGVEGAAPYAYGRGLFWHAEGPPNGGPFHILAQAEKRPLPENPCAAAPERSDPGPLWEGAVSEADWGSFPTGPAAVRDRSGTPSVTGAKPRRQLPHRGSLALCVQIRDRVADEPVRQWRKKVLDKRTLMVLNMHIILKPTMRK